LEAQRISVGIVKVELLHPVWRDAGRLKLKALRTQFLIDRVHIGGAEIDARILVRCGACGIGRHWTLVIEFVLFVLVLIAFPGGVFSRRGVL